MQAPQSSNSEANEAPIETSPDHADPAYCSSQMPAQLDAVRDMSRPAKPTKKPVRYVDYLRYSIQPNDPKNMALLSLGTLHKKEPQVHIIL